MSTKGLVLLKNLQMTKEQMQKEKISIGSFMFLKNLQTTEKKTHEERKQALEA
jgi:hypothetical protein